MEITGATDGNVTHTSVTVQLPLFGLASVTYTDFTNGPSAAVTFADGSSSGLTSVAGRRLLIDDGASRQLLQAQANPALCLKFQEFCALFSFIAGGIAFTNGPAATGACLALIGVPGANLAACGFALGDAALGAAAGLCAFEAASGGLPGCGTGTNFCVPSCSSAATVGIAAASSCTQHCAALTEQQCCPGCPKSSALSSLGCATCLTLEKAACDLSCGPC